MPVTAQGTPSRLRGVVLRITAECPWAESMPARPDSAASRVPSPFPGQARPKCGTKCGPSKRAHGTASARARAARARVAADREKAATARTGAAEAKGTAGGGEGGSAARARGEGGLGAGGSGEGEGGSGEGGGGGGEGVGGSSGGLGDGGAGEDDGGGGLGDGGRGGGAEGTWAALLRARGGSPCHGPWALPSTQTGRSALCVGQRRRTSPHPPLHLPLPRSPHLSLREIVLAPWKPPQHIRPLFFTHTPSKVAPPLS